MIGQHSIEKEGVQALMDRIDKLEEKLLTERADRAMLNNFLLGLALGGLLPLAGLMLLANLNGAVPTGPASFLLVFLSGLGLGTGATAAISCKRRESGSSPAEEPCDAKNGVQRSRTR